MPYCHSVKTAPGRRQELFLSQSSKQKCCFTDCVADLQTEQGRLVGSCFSGPAPASHSDGCCDCHLHGRCPLAQLLLTFPLNRVLHFVVVFLPHLFLIRVYNF